MELNICYLMGGSIAYFLGGLRKKKVQKSRVYVSKCRALLFPFLLFFFWRVNWQTNHVKEFRKDARKLVLHE